MSSDILVLAEHRRGVVTEATMQTITAASELAAGEGSVVVALAANAPESLVAQVSVAGVDEVVVVRVQTAEFSAEEAGAAFDAVIDSRSPWAVVAPFSATLASLSPALAMSRSWGFASDVTAVEREGEEIVARRPYYGGKVEALLELPGDGAVLLLRPAVWTAAAGDGSPVVSEVALGAVPGRSTHLELIEPEAGEADISKAEVVLAVGRGVGERENIARFVALADRLGVTLASSRPLVDAGWLPKFRQVGQSGVAVKPRLYIALGISGAVQHIAGIKGSETIFAVNTDPQAPIFEIADLGAVADIFEVADELEAIL